MMDVKNPNRLPMEEDAVDFIEKRTALILELILEVTVESSLAMLDTDLVTADDIPVMTADNISVNHSHDINIAW